MYYGYIILYTQFQTQKHYFYKNTTNCGQSAAFSATLNCCCYCISIVCMGAAFVCSIATVFSAIVVISWINLNII